MANYQLRELRIFQMMMDVGTTTAVARAMGISQSVVSRALSQLESCVGVILFTRNGARLEPTEEAHILLREIEPIFRCVDWLDSFAKREKNKGQVRIAATANAYCGIITDAVSRFQKRFPDVQFDVHVAPTHAVYEMVADRKSDIGITDSPIRDTSLIKTTILEGRVGVLLPKGHPLGGKRVLTPYDFDNTAFVVAPDYHEGRHFMDRLFNTIGVNRRIMAEASDSLHRAALVAEGVGATLTNPFFLQSHLRNAVTVHEFSEKYDDPVIAITAHDAPPSRHIRAFLAFMKMVNRRPPSSGLNLLSEKANDGDTNAVSGSNIGEFLGSVPLKQTNPSAAIDDMRNGLPHGLDRTADFPGAEMALLPVT